MSGVTVHQATFHSAHGADSPLAVERRSEIAVFGRSNVGKSTLINSLLQRKKLAQTSKSPGKTRSINFYAVDLTFEIMGQRSKFYLVDFPGYGYARYSMEEREKFNRGTVLYVRDREQLALSLILVDAKRGLTDDERAIIEIVCASAASPIDAITVIATKMDRFGLNERKRLIAALQRECELPVIEAGRDLPLEPLWGRMAQALKGSVCE